MGLPSRPQNGLSLCAGGGGLDLGLMLAEPGFHTRCWVEWEEYPRSVIIAGQRAGYFAPAPIWDDLTTFDARPFAGCIDTLLAGYPCQPFSHAGQRKGADDERHLWPDVARVARELGPSLEWLLLENVAGHVSLGLETVLRDLRDMDFTPAVGLFSAAETGAPHERLRVFIVAHSQRERGRDGSAEHDEHDVTIHFGQGSGQVADAGSGRHGGSRQGEVEQPGRAEAERSSCNLADTDGRDASTEGLQRSGEQRLYPEGGRFGGRGNGVSVADPGCAELEGQQPGQRDPCGRKEPHGYSALRGGTGLFPPGPGDSAAWADTVAVAPDLAPATGIGDCLAWAGRLAQAVEVSEQAEIESALRRMADGLALRSRALRLLGNGVHPLAAGHAWRTLSAAHGLRPLDLVAARDGDSAGADEFDMRAAE